MENHIIIIALMSLLTLLIILIIIFIIFVTDYFRFKDGIEKILNLNTEINNDTKEVINITKKVNNSVGQICELNDRIIIHLNNLLKENNSLKNKIKDKEKTDEE